MEVGDEGRWLDLEEVEPVFVPTGHDHMTCLHMTRLIRVIASAASPQLAAPSAGRIQPHPPLPSSEGCGQLIVNQRGSWGVEKREGGPRKWEAQAVRHENRQRHLSLPVFSHSFFLRPPLMPVTPRLPPPPPPLRPNASRRWFFSFFRHVTHHHHLPCIQSRAGGGVFRSFDTSPTTTTSLASKREPEVVFSSIRLPVPPPPPPSRPNTSWRWSISAILMHLPPPPPPSHPNVSWRWFFRLFDHLCHHHHLPRVQTRAGGGRFQPFRHDSHHLHLPRVQMRAGGGQFQRFRGVCRRRHITATRELTTAQMDGGRN